MRRLRSARRRPRGGAKSGSDQLGRGGAARTRDDRRALQSRGEPPHEERRQPGVDDPGRHEPTKRVGVMTRDDRAAARQRQREMCVAVIDHVEDVAAVGCPRSARRYSQKRLKTRSAALPAPSAPRRTRRITGTRPGRTSRGVTGHACWRGNSRTSASATRSMLGQFSSSMSASTPTTRARGAAAGRPSAGRDECTASTAELMAWWACARRTRPGCRKCGGRDDTGEERTASSTNSRAMSSRSTIQLKPL